MPFEPSLLRLLDQTQEVVIETVRPDGSHRRTVIWVMVDGDEVFVRSVRGDRGHWFQAASEPGAEVALIVEGQRVPVSAHDATDGSSIQRCSRALERKYAGDQSLPSMIRPTVLDTTLRLEPA